MIRWWRWPACIAVVIWCCCHEALSQGHPPVAAAGRMTVADGFSVILVASEPEVRQPILVKFDDRGRLWVIQYLQYPNPAELKRVKVDRYSRTVYDRVPEPPPRGPAGADRITICEDTEGDGRADRFKDFVSGLNLVTGVAFGHGGVFVLQVPYLLFYPDRDRNDVPDSDPEVLLEGFGMEDAQALANHLTWGPDGWLYGLNGSTTTCNIRGIEFQQGVWRYHPITKEFELFCEGGGNCYGLDFDRHGNLFYSSNGSHKVWHGVQGAYYWKQFTKHGALHNPYTFGYFGSVKRVGDYRGGHVTTGGCFYYGDTFPDRFRGQLIGNNLLSHEVHWHTITPDGSTFQTGHGGELLLANDAWFAPTDLIVGPDGAAYLCDFHDKRTAHPDPDAEWDRTNGRVYRIQAAGAKPAPHVDLNTLPSDKLVDWLGHSNSWYTRRARRILAERREPSVIPRLRKTVIHSDDDQLVLEALWALYVSGGFEDEVARHTLQHRSPPVRSWTVRLLGDARDVSAEIQAQLVRLAGTEASPVVRSQLACTSKRLPAEKSLPIVWQLLLHEEDREDAHIPLLLWWAVESKACSAQSRVVQRLTSPEAWQAPLVREDILGRLMRRYAAEATDAALEACVRLIASAPNASDRQMLIAALDDGLGGGQLNSVPEPFSQMVAELVDPRTSTDARLLRLALRCRIAGAHDRVIAIAVDRKTSTAKRVAMVEILGQMGESSCVPGLLSLLEWDEQHDVEVAAVKALARFDDDRVPARILKEYPRFSPKLKTLCRQTLFTRREWALRFLGKVDGGEFDAEAVSIEELRGLEVFDDEEVDALVVKHWGRITRGTPEEKLADVRRFNNDLRAFGGNPRNGYRVYKEHCGKCHKLFGDGEKIGPDLTSANRKDRQYMLISIVDPSSYIRAEYLSVQVVTDDGRILIGLITDETPTTITLVNSNNESTTIARENIDEMEIAQISQMPEDSLKTLKPQELRDLFAYLESDGPLSE
jgi:putative membrane-bound dehydrogenase-like protein